MEEMGIYHYGDLTLYINGIIFLEVDSDKLKTYIIKDPKVKRGVTTEAIVEKNAIIENTLLI